MVDTAWLANCATSGLFSSQSFVKSLHPYGQLGKVHDRGSLRPLLPPIGSYFEKVVSLRPVLFLPICWYVGYFFLDFILGRAGEKNPSVGSFGSATTWSAHMPMKSLIYLSLSGRGKAPDPPQQRGMCLFWSSKHTPPQTFLYNNTIFLSKISSERGPSEQQLVATVWNTTRGQDPAQCTLRIISR